MIFKNIFFGKYEVCDGFYNSLLCIIMFFKCQSLPHIQKDVFHDQYQINVLKKVESKAPLI